MKKKQHWLKALILCSLTLFLTGCTTLDYIGDDLETTKSSRIQTNELFSLSTYQKSIGEQSISVGISQTPLDGVMVLYFGIQNNSDVTYKFDVEDIKATSGYEGITFISPVSYIEAYQNFEAANYASMASAGAMLNNFTAMQQQYRNTMTPTQRIENNTQNTDLMSIQQTISGIQKHAITTFKYIEPNSKDYFYLFLRKPDEYPITIEYKNLTYKFGKKKDEN